MMGNVQRCFPVYQENPISSLGKQSFEKEATATATNVWSHFPEEHTATTNAWKHRDRFLESRAGLQALFCTLGSDSTAADVTAAVKHLARLSTCLLLADCRKDIVDLIVGVYIFLNKKQEVKPEDRQLLSALTSLLHKSQLSEIYTDLKLKIYKVRTASELLVQEGLNGLLGEMAEGESCTSSIANISSQEMVDLYARRVADYLQQEDGQIEDGHKALASSCLFIFQCVSFFWTVHEGLSIGEALWHYFSAIVSATNKVTHIWATQFPGAYLPFPERHFLVPVRAGSGYPFDVVTAKDAGEQLCQVSANMETCLKRLQAFRSSDYESERKNVKTSSLCLGTQNSETAENPAVDIDETDVIADSTAEKLYQKEADYEETVKENNLLKAELADKTEQMQEMLENSLQQGGKFEEVSEIGLRPTDLVNRYKLLFKCTGEKMLDAVDMSVQNRRSNAELSQFRLSVFTVIRQEMESCKSSIIGSLDDIFHVQPDKERTRRSDFITIHATELLAAAKCQLKEKLLQAVKDALLRTEFSTVYQSEAKEAIDGFVAEGVSFVWDVTTCKTLFEFQSSDTEFNPDKHDAEGKKCSEPTKIQYFVQPTMFDLSSNQIAFRGIVAV
eukprot:m.21678 g.21678  ORF g.21678 m.21678 type:complete len:616 (+) comp28200_c0_seq4:53-1900(+)